MEISDIIKKLNYIHLNFGDNYHQELLILQKQISHLLLLEENKLFHDYCNFMDTKTHRLNKKRKLWNDKNTIYQDTILEYFKKEEKYKYPLQLTELQNNIQHKIKQKNNNIIQIKKSRRNIQILGHEIISLKHQLMVNNNDLEQTHLEILFCTSNFDNQFDKIQLSYNLKLLHLNLLIDLEKYFIKNTVEKKYHQQFKLVIQHLDIINQYDNFIKSYHHQHNLILNMKNTDINAQDIKLKSLEYKLKFETDTKLNQEKLILQNIKIIIASIKKYKIINKEKNTRYNIKKKNLERLKEWKIKKLYQNIEYKFNLKSNKTSNLKLLDTKLTNNFNKINHGEIYIESLEYKNSDLRREIKDMESQKNKMLPKIIKTYNFYMNFYNCDLKKIKIEINTLQIQIDKIKNQKFEHQTNTKMYRQKINILKNLELKIHTKLNGEHTTNKEMEENHPRD